MSKLHVLAIDDEPENLEFVARTLRQDFEVTTTEQPEEALRLLESAHFDLILADQRMPGHTGVDILERAGVQQPWARRVIISGYTDAPDLLAAINRGQIHRFLSKPVAPEELLSCARSLTSGLLSDGKEALVVDANKDRAVEVLEVMKGVGFDVTIRKPTEPLNGGPSLGLVVVTDPESPKEMAQLASSAGGANRSAPIMVALSSERAADSAAYLSSGADDVLLLPLQAEELRLRLRAWQAKHTAELEAERLRTEILSQQRFFDIVGQSEEMKDVFGIVERVARTDTSVLINGETGTGKELIAKAVHASSHRRNSPFVAVNLAAVPETLMESELFGHEAGAFTGANNKRIGRFETAQGGTLFLDEIGDLPMPVQVKLLRVLQEKTFERVGGSQSIEASFRLVSATHRDLEAMIEEGTFREDLYYRINVVKLELPALRNRKTDIPILAHYFLDRFRKAAVLDDVLFNDDALKAMNEHAWPGNVRELENAIERAVALSQNGDRIGSDFIMRRKSGKKPMRDMVDDFFQDERGLAEVISDIEKSILVEVMNRCDGNLSAAAKQLQIPRQTLQSKLKKYELS